MTRRRVVVAGVALALDAACGELPNRWHPVAWFGRGAALFERRVPHTGAARGWLAGLALLVAALALAVGAALVTRRATGRLHGAAGIATEALLLKQAFAARALFAHARAVQEPLAAGDLPAARAMAARMVSRDTSALDGPLLASAAVESVAENLSDSAVAPIGWYLAGGLPAAFAYRAVNTLDAMVGYRANGAFGTPAARLDDLLNLVPARLTALLIVLAGGVPLAAARGACQDHAATPSPNAGWPMAAMAHALGVRLEKPGHHVLNAGGQLPVPGDVGRANRTGVRALVVGAVLAAVLCGRRR